MRGRTLALIGLASLSIAGLIALITGNTLALRIVVTLSVLEHSVVLFREVSK